MYLGCISCLGLDQQNTRQVAADQPLLWDTETMGGSAGIYVINMQVPIPTIIYATGAFHFIVTGSVFEENSPCEVSLRPWQIGGGNFHINKSFSHTLSGLCCLFFTIGSYVSVIVWRNSQPVRLRVSRPDLGLADVADWPVCGLATAHKHTLWSRCYFRPAC